MVFNAKRKNQTQAAENYQATFPHSQHVQYSSNPQNLKAPNGSGKSNGRVSRKHHSNSSSQSQNQPASQSQKHFANQPASKSQKHFANRSSRRQKDLELKIIPLGGLDGIGKNMTAFECGGDLILVDAGLMFPDDDQPGIDLILPDYSYVLENEHKLKGIVVTHGHEDHTGALPYLLMDLNVDCPIYASKLTNGLIKGKLSEHNLNRQRLINVSPRERITLGNFEVNFFSMTHSIPGAFGLYIKTPAGTVMHTGDFKLDQTPIDGVTPDFQALAKFGAEGVDLLLSDSTNSNVPGFTGSEASVGKSLYDIIKNAPGRVFVASFSSHIHRLQQICNAAAKTRRKVVVTGRSMVTNIKIAKELGYLKVPKNLIIDAFDTDKIHNDKVIILCTGSQGEPLSALSRMATGDHKTLSITKDDTVIISATPVPGNEKSVQSIINSLSKIGCAIFDKSNAHVHVSGHASQEELKLVLAMVKPAYFAPIHGEAMHLRAHSKLAQILGIPQDHIFILENGDTLLMNNHKVRQGNQIDTGVFFVDGMRISDADSFVLRDRQKLSNDGLITCVASVSKRFQSASDIEIATRGTSFSEDREVIEGAENLVRETIDNHARQKGSTAESMKKAVRKDLSNYIWTKTHTRPMIVPVVLEV